MITFDYQWGEVARDRYLVFIAQYEGFNYSPYETVSASEIVVGDVIEVRTKKESFQYFVRQVSLAIADHVTLICNREYDGKTTRKTLTLRSHDTITRYKHLGDPAIALKLADSFRVEDDTEEENRQLTLWEV
jgi:hypothetical protein